MTFAFDRIGIARRFARAERGSIMIEFATTGMAVILMLLTLMEGAGMMVAQGAMDSAVNRAARYGMTGAGGDFGDRKAQIVEMIREAAGGILDPEKIAVDTVAFNDFGSVSGFESFFDENGNGAYDSGEAFDDANGDGVMQQPAGRSDPGGSGEVVVYQVAYRWEGLTPLMQKMTNGGIILRSSLPVKNEQF